MLSTRIHGTAKREVAVVLAEEKPALVPLPVEPFRHYQFGERTVDNVPADVLNRIPGEAPKG